MINSLFILFITLATFITAVLLFRKQLVHWLHRLRGKLHIQSLRKAIIDADKDKEKTGRKNMVVMNSTSGSFEPVQKSLLKFLSNKNKGHGDTGKAKVRKKNGKVVKVMNKKRKSVNRTINPERIHQLEKKSLYVTN